MGVARTAVPQEQLAERARQPDPRGRIANLGERLGQVLSRRRISRQRLGLAQLAEHDAAQPGLGWLAERAAQQADGGVGCAVGQGLAGGVAEQRDDGGVARRLAAQQVRSDPCAAGALGRQQEAGPAVPVGQRGGRDPLVHRAP